LLGKNVMTHSKPSLADIREVLATTPSTLRALIAGMPRDALHYREAPGAWTPAQVLAHVTDGDITDWMPRLSLMLTDGGPKRFTPYDREGGFARYAGWEPSALLEELERLRAANLMRLRALDLTEAELARTGVHPELGVVTIAQLLACWATHDLAHIAQISRALTRYFGAHVGPWRAYFSLLQ
jgi:hypothetical protein